MKISCFYECSIRKSQRIPLDMLQELDDLHHMVEALQQTMDAIPAEILDVYRELNRGRKEAITIE